MATITTDLTVSQALGILTAAILNLADKLTEHATWVEDELVTIQENLDDLAMRRYH